MKTPRNFLLFLWFHRIRLRIEPDGKTVTPYDPHGRVSPLLVEECQKRSARIMPMVRAYIARQEEHCAAWEATQGQSIPTVSQLGKRKRGKEEMRQGVLI